MDLQALELSFLLHLQELHTPVLDGIMTVITHLGDGGVLFIAMGVLMLFFSRTRKVGLAVLLSLLGGFLVGNLLLKNLAARERPCWLMPEVLLLIESPHDYSFPSGHTLASFETAFSIFLYNKKWGIAAEVLAALIAFSRLYHFVHFPTDVLAALLLAAVIALLVHKWIEKSRICDILHRKKK